MTAIQILLNNLLYDLSEADDTNRQREDEEYIQKPKKLDIAYIRRFMVIFGPLSSIFDFITFFLLFVVFKAAVPVFQTACLSIFGNAGSRGFCVENPKNAFLQKQAWKIPTV